MATTNVHLGGEASRDYLLQSFNFDERALEILVDAFQDIAIESGSSAVLCLHTATVLVDSDDGDHDYAEFLAEAKERAIAAWIELDT